MYDYNCVCVCCMIMQMLTLPSGERVVGEAECGLRLVLETGNMNTATPASLHTCVSSVEERHTHSQG